MVETQQMLKRSRREGKNIWKNCLRKDLNELDYYDGVVSHPEPDILECEVKWALRCTAVNNGEGNGTPLQYSCLKNPMDGGALQAAVHGVAKIRTRLSDFTFTFPFHALEKEMATHSSVLAWRIPGLGDPGELPSMGLHRVGHD